MFRFLNSKPELKGVYFNQVPAVEGGDWIKIVPVGDFPRHPNGAHIIEKKHIEEMAANFNDSGVDLLFDYEHESLWGKSLAAGWAAEAEARDDGLYIKYPDFTPKAQEMIRNKEYRYFSPAYKLAAMNKDGRDIGAKLIHVALTNIPYMDREIDHIRNSQNGDIDMKFSKELLEKLGLDENATDEQIEAKINSLTEKPEEEPDANGVNPDSSQETSPEAPSKGGDEADPVLAEIQKLNSRLDRIEAKDTEAIVNAAISDQKILPRDKDVWLNAIKADPTGTMKKLNEIKPGAVKPGSVNVPDGDPNGGKDDSLSMKVNSETQAKAFKNCVKAMSGKIEALRENWQ